MLHIAFTNNMRRQRLLRTHFPILKNLGVVAFDVIAKEFVVLGVMARNVIIYSEFEFLELKQILHRELERGGAVAAAGMVLHSANALLQRLHRLDDRVYHQLRTGEIAAKHIETAQRRPHHRKDIVFLREIVDFLYRSSCMMVHLKRTPFIIRIIKVQEAHRLSERRASETMDIHNFFHS